MNTLQSLPQIMSEQGRKYLETASGFIRPHLGRLSITQVEYDQMIASIDVCMLDSILSKYMLDKYIQDVATSQNKYGCKVVIKTKQDIVDFLQLKNVDSDQMWRKAYKIATRPTGSFNVTDQYRELYALLVNGFTTAAMPTMQKDQKTGRFVEVQGIPTTIPPFVKVDVPFYDIAKIAEMANESRWVKINIPGDIIGSYNASWTVTLSLIKELISKLQAAGTPIIGYLYNNLKEAVVIKQCTYDKEYKADALLRQNTEDTLSKLSGIVHLTPEQLQARFAQADADQAKWSTRDARVKSIREAFECGEAWSIVDEFGGHDITTLDEQTYNTAWDVVAREFEKYEDRISPSERAFRISQMASRIPERKPEPIRPQSVSLLMPVE